MRTERVIEAAAIVALLALCAAIGPARGAAAPPGIYAYTDDDGTLQLSDSPNDERYRLVLRNPEDYTLKASPGGRPPAPGTSMSAAVALEARPYHTEIVSAAGTHGLDPALVHAVISAESAYNTGAVSKAGAVGLMQLMPDTARRYGVLDARDPVQNIVGGVRYLTDLIRMFNGDLTLVLAAYNAGENAVLRYGKRVPPYPETLLYVPRVLAFYRRYLRSTEPRDY